ncbi:MAG: S-ribosylhomocysteine lyase [Muribaculaceae bacterium]|nr:S-ribosylhomocysteine lyase [Muribaculaceae bacterium]
MEKIASFQINHLLLERGIFVSRRDTTPQGDELTTFDIRLTRPNREPAADPAALHTIEHLAATYLRNDPQWRDRVVYWGPMGCCTGSYLILQGHLESADILPLMRRMFAFIADFSGEIPGATARDCGNYTFNDLEGARRLAARFLSEVLANPAAENLNYPQ